MKVLKESSKDTFENYSFLLNQNDDKEKKILIGKDHEGVIKNCIAIK